MGLFLVNHVLAGTRCFRQKRWILNRIGFSVGEGTRVVGPIFCTGTLSVGKHCWIGRNLTIHGNGQVEIGDNCDLGPEVMFLTGGHIVGKEQRRAGTGQSYAIRVEDGCWIGARVTLGKEITVGRGSVCAACACVMKNLPPNTLVGGVPAERIRSLYEE